MTMAMSTFTTEDPKHRIKGEPMQVGLISYGLDRPLTGIGRYTVELARALAALENGPGVTLLAAGGAGPLADQNGLRSVPLPGCRLLPGLVTLANVVIPRLARRYELDIVHDPTGVSPFLFGTASARSVVTVHDVFPWSYPDTSTLLETLIYRYWLPRLLPRVDAVLTVSQASKSDIVGFLRVSSGKIRVVQEGVDEAYQPISPDRVAAARLRHDLPDEYMLYLGSTRKHKNLNGLLSAYDRLKRIERAPCLVLVGVSPEECRKTLVETVGNSSLQASITCISQVPEADLPSLYSGAVLFVRPVLDEGFGLPALEAMACGTPVVCSNVSSLPEVVGEAAITVDPNDVEALAEALHRVLTDADLRQDLRRRGLERAAEFTWEQTARETAAVYEEVLHV